MRRALVITGIVGMACAVAAPVVANWSVASSAPISATARALAQVTGVTASGGTTSVALAWSAETASGIVTGYDVRRYAASTGGSSTSVCPMALTSTALSCTDSTAPGGTSYYEVLAVYTPAGAPAPVWRGAASSPRAAATVVTALAAPDLEPLSDSGVSSTDDITRFPNPTFVGSAPVGATVRLFDGTREVGSNLADGTGRWSVTAATLAEGVRQMTVTVTQGPVTSAPSSALAVTIDLTAPVLTVTTKAKGPGGGNAAEESGTVSGTTGGAVNDLTAVTLAFTRAGGTSVTGAATRTGTTWSGSYAVANKTNWSLTASLDDKAGNTGVSPPFDFKT